MHKGFLILVGSLLLLLSLASATDIEIVSSSPKAIVLQADGEVTEIREVTATVETDTTADTYAVSAQVKDTLVIIDVTPLYEDYPIEEIQSILVSGTLDVEGETITFGKRVAVRATNEAQLAPEKISSSAQLGIGILVLIVIIFSYYLAANKPKKRQKRVKRKKKRARKK